MSEEQGGGGSAKLVGAVLQAVRLLQAIEHSERPLGVSALARAGAVNPSTAFNILRTLVAVDFVTFDAAAKTYRLGNGLLKLSEGLFSQSILDAIRPEVETLAAETNSLVGIWQITDDRLVLIDRAVSASPMRLEMALRYRMPLMSGALGRAMAVTLGLSDRKLKAEFKKLRWEEPVSAERYLEDVRDAARLGYGVDRGALFSGVTSVGAVIKDRTGTPIYGLTASIISGRVIEEQIAEIGARMVDLARAFTR